MALALYGQERFRGLLPRRAGFRKRRDYSAGAGSGRDSTVSRPGSGWRGINSARLQANQVRHADSLLALQVNGVDLSLDHGFPARIIVPALPGVHNTKWVRGIEFRTDTR